MSLTSLGLFALCVSLFLSFSFYVHLCGNSRNFQTLKAQFHKLSKVIYVIIRLKYNDAHTTYGDIWTLSLGLLLCLSLLLFTLITFATGGQIECNSSDQWCQGYCTSVCHDVCNSERERDRYVPSLLELRERASCHGERECRVLPFWMCHTWRI